MEDKQYGKSYDKDDAVRHSDTVRHSEPSETQWHSETVRRMGQYKIR